MPYKTFIKGTLKTGERFEATIYPGKDNGLSTYRVWKDGKFVGSFSSIRGDRTIEETKTVKY